MTKRVVKIGIHACFFLWSPNSDSISLASLPTIIEGLTRTRGTRWRAVWPLRSSPIVLSMLSTLGTRTSATRQRALQHQKLDCKWPPAPSTLIHALSSGDREARQRGPRAEVMEFNPRAGDQSLNPPSRICTLRRSYRPALATTRTKDSPRLRY
jgi:hypothetical protein